MLSNITYLFSSMFNDPPQFDLACVGTSIYGLSCLTFESVRYIAHADIVYYYPVTDHHLEFMKILNPNIVDLNNTLYTDGSNFDTAYPSIIEKIFDDVRSKKKVVYAQQGSPCFLAYTSIQLIRKARTEGFNAQMVPGVSSFECILANLTASHNVYDIQIYNCDSIVKGTSTINPKSACILFNLITYANTKISKSKNQFDDRRLELLSKALCKKYPISHPVTLIAVNPKGAYDIKLSNVEKIHEDLLLSLPTVSLFLPQVQ